MNNAIEVRMLLKLCLWFYFISNYTNVFCQNDSILSLPYCQEEAIKNYPSVKDKALLKKATELRLRNIETNLLPQLSLNGQATYQSEAIDINLPIPGHSFSFEQAKDQYKATLDINQTIFDGGTTRYQKQLENSSLEVNTQQVDVDLFKIRDQVNSVYFLLVSLQENEKLIRTSLQDIVEREKVVKSSVENGVLIPSDWDMLEAERLNTEQQLAEIYISRKNSLAVLSILIDRNIDKAGFRLPEVEIKDSLQTVRPEYKLFDLQTKQIEDSKLLSGTQIKPKIAAFGEGGYGRPGLNMLSNNFTSYYIFGVSFKWNFFDWNKNNRDRQVLDVQKDMINTQRDNFNKNLNIDLQNKLSNIKKLEEALTRDSMIVELRSRIARSSASQLENGVITATDYLIDLNNETTAKINFETHKIQLVQAKTTYLLAKGVY